MMPRSELDYSQTIEAILLQTTPQEILDAVQLEDPQYNDPSKVGQELIRIQRREKQSIRLITTSEQIESGIVRGNAFFTIHEDKGSTRDTKAIRVAITEKILQKLPATRREDLDTEINNLMDERGQFKQEFYVCPNSPKTIGSDGFIWRIGLRIIKRSGMPNLRQLGYVRTKETVAELMED